MRLTIPYSEACERNKQPILDVIQPILKDKQHVLEIGSGTGQHAIFFAKQLPHLQWQTSDQACYLEGISAQLQNANISNALKPIELDVEQLQWLQDQDREQDEVQSQSVSYDVVYTANTLHIMSWQQVQAFFAGLAQIKPELLILYGPFKYNGQYTSPSNANFDQSLQLRDPLSGIRDFEAIEELANQKGLKLELDQVMPANNRCLIFTI